MVFAARIRGLFQFDSSVYGNDGDFPSLYMGNDGGIQFVMIWEDVSKLLLFIKTLPNDINKESRHTLIVYDNPHDAHGDLDGHSTEMFNVYQACWMNSGPPSVSLKNDNANYKKHIIEIFGHTEQNEMQWKHKRFGYSYSGCRGKCTR